MSELLELRQQIQALKNPHIAQQQQRFFKTGPGEYAEGDLFLGIKVPQVRKISGAFRQLDFVSCQQLCQSVYHEERLCALLIWVWQMPRVDEKSQDRIYRFYIRSPQYINNWDLIDTTAPHIVGYYLEERSREPLYKLAHSRNLWKKRIAMLSCFHFIKKDDYSDALAIALVLLQDKHDLIHKAVGWMLREVGNRHRATEEAFLQQHYQQMPRTMLRYAIEKLPEPRRQAYLLGKI